jgi:hypothetical protein
MKRSWDSLLTTVFPRQGHYAHDERILGSSAPADIAIERIGDLLTFDRDRLIAAATGGQ